jgi:short subunit dehydrogenase-like uncharacterized protein
MRTIYIYLNFLSKADDDKALRELCAQTKVVVACAGPFARYGKKLVEAW